MGSALLESLLDRDALAGALRLPQPAWLADARRSAAESLAREGLPEPRTEAWKYTSLRALQQSSPVVGDVDAATRVIDASSVDLPGIAGPRLVFVNGVLRADLSRAKPEEGLSLSTLAEANPAQLEPWRAALAHEYHGAASAFARLNTALAADGPMVRVAAGARIADPVHMVFIGAGGDCEFAWYARALVEIGEGASLQLIEHHLGAGGSETPQLGNLVMQYVLAARSRLDLVQIQDAGAAANLIRRSEFVLGAGATLAAHTLEIGAQLTRHDLDVDLAGDGARFISRGVFALRARQHTDTHMDVTHTARDTTSDIVWRGVADQRARGVFHGSITVAAGADGADASLSNKNLLLSPHAEIDTQPVLEIHADEVKAAHGATVGELDEQALFYLRSRGLSPDAARHLLIAAFCRSALTDLQPAALREHLLLTLASRLPAVDES